MFNDKYLGSVVYGGVDGIITIFNIISGVEGAQLKYYVIFILGISSLISDAVSMGFSDYLSLNAENKVDKTRDPEEKMDSRKSGLITFLSFILFGLIPLLTYLFYSKYYNNKKTNYIKTYISTMIALFLLGSFQSKYTGEIWYKSGTYVVGYGILASFISYQIGKILGSLVKK